ncbi:MAG: HxlR family transcriptional regulator [Mesorhizobium sp.]|nr:MAG: HxlR family transcriptional regulator [Mesorhizobium sp.]RWM46918.1 MAG: HxlR family transcriptional regulator [Mesorhizobium sp.]RWM52770.1 MAG: HxlR family transcriptional regulator [Mesorhizobium sp.]RWM56397.1 MAG: HxlR family transcriptional regulator [Mesorhizobium sp.]RWM98685.1 MAG: HxlR family transcriptional regulator [Mesorhizobium sp.]
MAVVSDRHAVYDHRAQECTYKAHSVEKDTVMPRIRHDRFDCSPGCTVEGTLRYIDGKWKGVMLYHLFEGTLRFNEIRRRIPNCTQRMLTNQLRELEADGLIARKIYPQVPPKVEYSLTPRGRSLEPVITALKTWGDANVALGPQASQAAA